MCLEVLEGVKEIGGFGVGYWPEQRDPWAIAPPIIVNKSTNTIGFTLQNGPIKEAGVNGCQVDTLIEAAKAIIEGLNSKYPCYENVRAIEGLKDALKALDDRKKSREARGVEGLSKG